MQTYVDDVLNKMTIDEKIGQLNLVAPGGFTQTGPTVGGKNVKIMYAKGSNITDDPYLSQTINMFGQIQDTEKNGQAPEQLLREAVNIAGKADVIVAVLGESVAMSGEAASRADIGYTGKPEKFARGHGQDRQTGCNDTCKRKATYTQPGI